VPGALRDARRPADITVTGLTLLLGAEFAKACGDRRHGCRYIASQLGSSVVTLGVFLRKHLIAEVRGDTLTESLI
jgi:hypothetical protein